MDETPAPTLKERFYDGRTFAELVARPKDNAALWEALYKKASISPEIAMRLRNTRGQWHFLVLPKPDRYRHIRTWYARDHGATIVSEILSIIEQRMSEYATATG